MIEPRPVWDFLDSPCPYERGVILGKGPSLDRYEPEVHGKGAWVLGIKEAAEPYPCHAAICFEWAEQGIPFTLIDIPQDAVLFRTEESIVRHHPDKPGPTYLFRYTKGVVEIDGRDRLPCEQWSSTTIAGMTLMKLWGITSILLVGCDSEDEGAPGRLDYAKCIEEQLRLPQRYDNAPRKYGRINGSLKFLARKWQLDIEWLHRQIA